MSKSGTGALWRALATAFMLLIVAGCTTLQPLPSIDPSPYQLGAGDEVRVAVFGIDALTNDFVVNDSGQISMPLIGMIDARGKQVDELRNAVSKAVVEHQLVRSLNPSVTVQIQKYRPFYIMGEVQRPGPYPYEPGMTVLTAVTIAGGYTFRAETGYVAITRKSENGVAKGRAGNDKPVLPGDVIQVLEGWF